MTGSSTRRTCGTVLVGLGQCGIIGGGGGGGGGVGRCFGRCFGRGSGGFSCRADAAFDDVEAGPACGGGGHVGGGGISLPSCLLGGGGDGIRPTWSIRQGGVGGLGGRDEDEVDDADERAA